MWGSILTEVSFISNFHVGFNNTKSDILIHLTQWQYWWWFWFSYFWVLYFLLFMRIFRYRAIKFRPRIVTSFRPHGKWGDLIVCLLPVSWCLNIITNSNFILRMIEWQAESSLFTLRVRGKQWYWVYKYELKIVTDILTAPKNIGSNKWVITNPLDLQVADDYLHVHQLRSQSLWLKNHWSTSLVKEAPSLANLSSTSTSATLSDLNRNFKDNSLFFKNPAFILCGKIYSNYKSLGLDTTGITSEVSVGPKEFGHLDWVFNGNGFNGYHNKNVSSIIASNSNSGEELFDNIEENNFKKIKFFNTILKKKQNVLGDEFIRADSTCFNRTRKIYNRFLSKNFESADYTHPYAFGHSESTESLRSSKRGQSLMTPLRIIKYPLNTVTTSNSDNIELFRLRFNTEPKQVEPKINPHQTQWIFKQKRYKRFSGVKTKTRFYTDANGNLDKNIKFTYQTYIHKNRIILNDDKNYYSHYQRFKKNKKRTEEIKLPFNKRLLRTKRIVVLPAHVNLTVITNSFDVVHSWFIPGLGLKMDCVPGRSTHHVLHIDHVGFYYGQCAEICGRYHHHMPIRICALPFEHFLVWWHAFALPKLLKSSSSSRKDKYLYASRKYVW